MCCVIGGVVWLGSEWFEQSEVDWQKTSEVDSMSGFDSVYAQSEVDWGALKCWEKLERLGHSGREIKRGDCAVVVVGLVLWKRG